VTIIEFLEARIDTIERDINMAIKCDPYTAKPGWRIDTAHNFMLAECAAHRRIIARCVTAIEEDERPDSSQEPGYYNALAEHADDARAILGDLAAIWQWHPDYDPAWAA